MHLKIHYITTTTTTTHTRDTAPHQKRVEKRIKIGTKTGKAGCPIDGSSARAQSSTFAAAVAALLIRCKRAAA